jgi:hypothetical protein
MVMADAVRAVQSPRKYFPVTVEQTANPGFSCDLDRNDRPDGFTRCSDAPAEVIPPCGGRVAEFVSGTTTWIYGPEAGETKLTLTVRSGDDLSSTSALLVRYASVA